MIGNVAEWTADDVVGKYFHNCRGGCFDDTFARYNMGKATHIVTRGRMWDSDWLMMSDDAG